MNINEFSNSIFVYSHFDIENTQDVFQIKPY
jgi:hypothetical protein